ncbi:LPD38 domain-containing protein [Pseudoalteromonas sp. NCIMB_1079]|uniref:LPD38 domain-containing protein n=1 Tax=Pseudoalteromonas sp. NCIMB 1079 TaxID=3142847 RepID=UPI00339CFABD
MADKLQLLIEANERGLLKGKHKAMYDEALNRGLIKPSKPKAEGSLSAAFGAGVDKVQELGYRAVKGFTDVGVPEEEQTDAIGRTVGQGGTLSKWAQKGIDRNVEEQQEYEPTVKSYKDIDGLGSLGSYTGELVAGSLPYMAGAATGVGAFGMAGGLSNEAYEKQPEGEKDEVKAVASGAGQILLERLGIKVSMGQLGKDILKDGVVETAKRMGKGELVQAVRDPNFAKRVLMSAGAEGLTETGQEALAQWGAGKSIDEFEGLDEAFVGGVLVGGVMRTGSETAQKVMGYQQKSAEAVKDGVDQLVEAGAATEEAIETVKKQQFDSAIKQGFKEVEASAIVARTMKEKFGIDDPVFTAAAEPAQQAGLQAEQAQAIPEDTQTPEFKSDEVDYDAPTAARQAGFDETVKSAGQYGDMLTSPAQQSLRDLDAGNNAPTVDERVKAAAFDKSPTPEDRFSPIKYQHEGELLSQEAQNAQNVQGIDNAPIDGQVVPEQGKLPTTEQTKNREVREQAQADLESQPKGIELKDIIFGEDGRPQQRAAEQVKQAGNDSQNLLPQKDIIFADNESGVNVAKNGEVFKTKRDALLSKEARAARRAGHKTKAVSFDNGFGWKIKGDDGTKKDSEQAAAEQSPETDMVAQNEQGDQAQPAQQAGEALSLNVSAAPGKDEEDDKNIAVNDKVDGVQVIDTPVSELSLSKDIPQFKSGSNSDGVVEPLTGKFDPVGMSPVQVWVRENGNKEIITGRHRYDLAKRDGVENIPAQYHYESDGFTAEDGKRLDAILNIREDKGQVEDYVELFKQDGITESEAKQYGLLDRATGRTAFKIANSATNETIEAQRTGRISAQAAEAIAEAAPGNERLQILGIKSIADDQRSITFVKNLIHAVSALNTNQDQGGQSGDLFGFDDSAMQEAEQMAKVAAANQRDIRNRLSAIRGAANKPEIAKAEGINVKNPKALKKRTDELANEVKAWDNWHTNPEMVQQIRDSISAPKDGKSALSTAPITETAAEPKSTEKTNDPEIPDSSNQQIKKTEPPKSGFSLPESKRPEQLNSDTIPAENSQATVKQPSNKTEQASLQESIDDFGEKLGGARKDAWGGFSEAVQDQKSTTELPLSKAWPEPNYKELVEKGANAESAALIAAMRSEIPSKPRVARKVARWAEKVNTLKSFAADLMNGDRNVASVMQRMRNHSSKLAAVVDAIPSIAKADIDTLKNVADYRISSGSFSIFGGKTYSPSKVFYFIERNGRPVYDGASETLSDVQALLTKVIKAEQTDNANATSGKKSKISVYRDRYTKDIYLGWKGAGGVLKIKSFDDLGAARDHLKNNREEVEQTLQKIKETPSMRKPVNAERIGPERYAENVTPDTFGETFGFRGVEFGNWVEQAKRQKNLNQAYDGLMDLAEALDLPPKALSLNGKLGLAFGARGKGGKNPAAAHYEPNSVVINLTKKAGAGSLAHEWWHALDNYFGKQRPNTEFITESPYTLSTDEIRPEMANAFKHVRNAIVQSGLPERSKQLDTRRSKAYWATTIEMTARSFETYIIDKLKQQGITNDYLANVVLDEAWTAAESLGLESNSTYPYPNKAEQEKINPAYQTLFDTIESENTSEGIRLFSKSKPGKKANGVNAKQAQAIADGFITSLKGANGITVNILEDTATAEKLWRMSLDGATVKGAYSEISNTVYVIAENIDSETDLKQTLAHETIAHGGLDTVIGKEAKQEFIDRIKKTKGRKAFEKYWKDANNDYWDASEDVKAEEIFARFVESEPSKGEVKYWWNALKRFIRKQLDKLGVVYREDDEITAMREMLESIVKGFKAQRETSSNQDASLAYSQSGKKLSKKSQGFKGEIGKPLKASLVRKPLDWIIDNIDSFAQSDIESVLNQIDSNGDWKGIDSFTAKKALKSLTSDYSALEMQVKKNGLNVRDVEPIIAELDAKSNNFFSSDYSELWPNMKDEILGYLERDGVSDYEAHQLSGSTEPFKFSRTTDEDTRTAKQKLGLEEKAAKTFSDIAKDKVNETVDTLKSSPFWNRLNEGIFDGLSGIKNAEIAAGVTDPNRQGYVSARLASGLADVLHGVFNFGAPQWRDGIVQRKAGTKGLLEVFGMVGDDLNNWLAWMGAHRAEQLKAQGRENNLTDSDIAELKALANGKERLFEQTRLEYNKVNSAILDMAQEAGLLSEAQRSGFDEEYYVPFFRDMGETDPEMDDIKRMIVEPHTRKGISGQSAQLKSLKGGTQSTKDLLENIISRQSTFIDASLKNKAMQEVVNNLDGTDYMKAESSEDIASLSQQDLNKLGKVKVMVDGKPQAYVVSDPALLRALIQVNDVGSQSLFNRLGRSAKRFLTAGITLSPDFIFKNFVRDAAHAWMINKDGFKFGSDSIKGLKKAFKEDESYRDLIFSGAAFQGGYIHGADPEAGAQQMRRALRSKGLTSKEVEGYMATVVTSGATLLEKYRGISDKVENANRLSTYEAAITNGKSKRQAAYEAKDLMDYSLKGNFKLIGTMIDMLPFFNARLQGMSKLVRAAKASNDDRALRVLSANLAMKGVKVAAFSMALAAMNDDDEDYQQLPDWDKDMNWHIFADGEHIRIPKPFELGIVFGTLPERLFHYGTGTQTDKDLGKSVANAVFNTMALNPIPQMVLPAAEVMINKSFFKGSPIEGMADQNKQAEDRYNAYTSDTAKAIAQQFGVSPKKVEHLIKGYTGTIGGYVLGASDIVARQIMGKESPETPVSRYPVVKAFYQGSGPKTNTKFANDFYEALDAANQAYGSYKRAMELGDTARQQELIEKDGKKLKSKATLAKVQRMISKLRKMQKAINDNDKLDGKQKREKLDDVQRRINAIYHKAYVTLNLGEW